MAYEVTTALGVPLDVDLVSVADRQDHENPWREHGADPAAADVVRALNLVDVEQIITVRTGTA